MSDGTCTDTECDNPSLMRGLCSAHYQRARRSGTLPTEWRSRMRNTLADFLLERIEVDHSGCWLWTGRAWPNGYGSLAGKPRKQAGTAMSHRAVYELHNGPIPDDLVIDHLCRNRICCNPEHLEPVTQAENLARGESPTIQVAQTGVCFHGHRIEGDNLYVSPQGQRRCRTCLTENRSARYQKYKAEHGIPDAKKQGTCSEDGCDRIHNSKGLCRLHYVRSRRALVPDAQA